MRSLPLLFDPWLRCLIRVCLRSSHARAVTWAGGVRFHYYMQFTFITHIFMFVALGVVTLSVVCWLLVFQCGMLVVGPLFIMKPSSKNPGWGFVLW